MPDADELKQQICDVGARLYQRGLVAGADGNISVRLTDREVLCTPSSVCKGRMNPADICLVDMVGNQLAGSRKKTSELLLHLEILRARPDVHGVVHSHAPHASAFAITGRPVPPAATAEAAYFLGDVPTAPYETPGTAAFAQTVLPFVEQTNVCLLANHGCVTYADTLEHALHLSETLDAYCRTLLLAENLGPVRALPPAKRDEIEELRVRAGVAPPAISREQ